MKNNRYEYQLERLKFYLIILFELFLSPVLYIYNFLKWTIGKYFYNAPKSILINRQPVVDNVINICIHEWGGYEGKRIKIIKGALPFECGLYYQLQRFNKYRGKYVINTTVTLSDHELLASKIEAKRIINVSNRGMDFSGYSAFYSKIKDKGNRYIILTNSSVNAQQEDFLEGYIDFLEKNLNVGMLGVSYSSRIYQSVIKNNFNPHLQSFFLITTTEVLDKIVKLNNKFPGAGVDYKLSLIRKGEVRLSNSVMELGYSLACVLENGSVHVFDKGCLTDNGHSSWKVPFMDYRLITKHPNKLNSIKY